MPRTLAEPLWSRCGGSQNKWVAFLHSPKAVLLWESRSFGLCLLRAQGSTEESGPDNQGEEEGVQWGAANPSFFFPQRYLCGCSRELLPAWLRWQDGLRQGEELPVLPGWGQCSGHGAMLLDRWPAAL